MRTFITGGWKGQDSIKIPADPPKWQSDLDGLYDQIVAKMASLEKMATQEVHEDPMIAGMMIGAAVGVALVLLFLVVRGCLLVIGGGKKQPQQPQLNEKKKN